MRLLLVRLLWWSISPEKVEAVIMERLPRHIPSTVVDIVEAMVAKGIHYGVESSWNCREV
jgi:hypothetical protein